MSSVEWRKGERFPFDEDVHCERCGHCTCTRRGPAILDREASCGLHCRGSRHGDRCHQRGVTTEINKNPDDQWGVAGQVDFREDPHVLRDVRSSYGDWPVSVDLKDFDRDREMCAEIMAEGDVRIPLVVCLKHRTFFDGRHRLHSALWVGMSSLPCVDRCYCDEAAPKDDSDNPDFLHQH